MLNLLLIGLLVIFVLPQPIGKTIKKIWPAVSIAIVIGLSAFAVQIITEKNNNYITVEALNRKNSKSEGEEIWLKEVKVDGVSYHPSEYFGDNWIEDRNYLIWRPYDQKPDMENKIIGQFETGNKVSLIFQSNKWRGKARISVGSENQELDFYKNTDSEKEEVIYETIIPEVSGTHINLNKKTIVIFIFLSLVILNIICSLFVKQNPLNHTVFEREVWIDCLKVISTIMIILIHSSGNIYTSYFAEDSQIWIKALWANAIPRFAVPCFFMLSGALLLHKECGLNKKLIDRVIRILIPLFIWSCIYVFAKKMLWNGSENLLHELIEIPFKNKDGALWYGYQLIWLYLGLPVWNKLYETLSVQLKWYFVIFSLGIPGILNMISGILVLNVSNYLPFAAITPMLCYVGLLFLGRLLYDINISDTKKMKLMSIAVSCIGIFLMVACSTIVSKAKGQAISDFFSEVRLPAVIYASGVFLLFRSSSKFLQELPHGLKIGVQKLSEVSLGIYFSHCLILWILPQISIGSICFNRDSGSMKQLAVCVMIYYIAAAVTCGLLSRIPGLKKLVL